MAGYKETTIDGLTGEVLDEKIKVRKKIETQHFVMFIKENMHLLFRLKEGMAIKVYLKLADLAGFETNIVHLTAKAKEDAANDIGCALGTFNNSLVDLKKAGLIQKRKGDIMLNPHISWSGKTIIRENEGITNWRNFNS